MKDSGLALQPLKRVASRTVAPNVVATPAVADLAAKTATAGKALKAVPFFKLSLLAKVGLGGMLLDIPFVGRSHKDGEISAKKTFGRLAAAPLNWIAFKGAMRLPTRWLPQLKGSPLGIAAGLTADMLAPAV